MTDPGDTRDSAPDDVRAPAPMLRALFETGPRRLTAVLMLAGIAINFANVVGRYLFGYAIFWAEEIMIFLIVWCVFLGGVTVAFNGAHLRMDLLSARLPSPWKEAVNGIAAVALIVCCGFAAVQSWKVLRLLFDGGDVSITASVPMVIPHAALFFGLVLTALAVAVRLRAHLRNRF